MSEGLLYQKMKTLNQPGAYPVVDSCTFLDDAKKSFPVSYEYDSWEMPETNKQKEKKICEILGWYQKYFGKPSNNDKATEKVEQ